MHVAGGREGGADAAAGGAHRRGAAREAGHSAGRGARRYRPSARRGSQRLPALHHSSGLSGVGKGSSIVESPKPACRPCDGAKRVDVENQLRGQSVY